MFNAAHKGLIALDIDGTLTAETAIPIDVVDYLCQLEKQGWLFAFITGRPFNWAYQTLQSLPFSSLFAVQNGALLFELPSKRILNRRYLTASLIPPLESICHGIGTDFVVYSGYENADACYYRSTFFSSEILTYILSRTKYLGENWLEVTSFDHLPVNTFTSFKCFGNEKQARFLSMAIEKQLKLHSPPIRDPFSSQYYVVQATHPQASKGEVIQDIVNITGFTGPVIAAGNDNNDLGMLQAATVKIAMADAPASLLDIADIIAPLAAEKGIVQGLSQALGLIQ